MAIFHVTIEVGDLRGTIWEPMEALVDTGSTRTKAPRDLLVRLGITPTDTRAVRLANGQIIQREVAEARIRLHGKHYTNLVTFGEPGEEPLLGSLTLETFSLAVDPVNRRLVPVEDLEMVSR